MSSTSSKTALGFVGRRSICINNCGSPAKDGDDLVKGGNLVSTQRKQHRTAKRSKLGENLIEQGAPFVCELEQRPTAVTGG